MGEHRIIRNFDQLATTSLRRDALNILESGYEAVSMSKVIAGNLKRERDILRIGAEKIDLAEYDRLFFVAFGKCAVSSAEAIEPLILDRLTWGAVLDVDPGRFAKLKSYVGTHPFLSEANVQATSEIVNQLSSLTEKDLVVISVSGGGSALFTLPSKLGIDDSAKLIRLGMEKGATIGDLNTVRRHLSLVKGGGLAKLLYPAKVVSIIFSDVPGNDLATIASGPTVFDKTTVSDAQAVIARHGLFEILSWPNFELIETPKEEKYFEHVKNILLLTNDAGLSAMKIKAEELGYAAFIKNGEIEGKTDLVGKMLAETEIPAKTCFLYGGETTVNIKGSGKGGRCQELALSALRFVRPGELILAAASDGWDNTEAAGAIIDRELFLSVSEVEEVNQYLSQNDSYNFFQKYGGQIMTGRTGANVSDFYLIVNGA